MHIFYNPIFFSADLFALLWFYNTYRICSEALKAMQMCPVFSHEIEEILRSGGSMPYCVVEGRIQAGDDPIESMTTHGVTGVIQRLKIIRYFISKDLLGIWWNHRKETVRDSVRQSKMTVKYGMTEIALTDRFTRSLDSWHMLQLKTVADQLQVASNASSSFDQGFEFTEKMLTEGTKVTAVGSITFDGQEFTLSPPGDGTAHYLTTWSRSTLLAWLKLTKKVCKYCAIAAGALAVLIACEYAFWWWLQYKRTCEKYAEIHSPMLVPGPEAPEVQLCVVCRYYARDVLLLPCKHFSLCRACVAPMKKCCPVCRNKFISTIVVYVA